MKLRSTDVFESSDPDPTEGRRESMRRQKALRLQSAVASSAGRGLFWRFALASETLALPRHLLEHVL